MFTHDYIINIAKMKAHSLAGVTLCMKNIFGFIPTRKQKLMYHPFIRKAVLDMNQIVPSHFSIVDGVLNNEFPVYATTDTNAEPTKNRRIIYYTLEHGEASRILRPFGQDSAH